MFTEYNLIYILKTLIYNEFKLYANKIYLG